MILKADKFKFPTKEERKLAASAYPKLESFGFSLKNEFEVTVIDNLPIEEAVRVINLPHWDLCLSNRFAKLRETYICIMTNYNRGFSETFAKSSENEVVNKLMFDYYAEMFYYYYFSTRDVIAQILNLYFKIGWDAANTKISFTKKHFIESISSDKVPKAIEDFNQEVSSASEFRNKFTHRFTPSQKNFFATIKQDKSLAIGRGDATSSATFVSNIKEALKSLKKLMSELKKEIIPNT